MYGWCSLRWRTPSSGWLRRSAATSAPRACAYSTSASSVDEPCQRGAPPSPSTPAAASARPTLLHSTATRSQGAGSAGAVAGSSSVTSSRPSVSEATLMRLWVSVPVLSKHTVSTAPRFSTASSRRA